MICALGPWCHQHICCASEAAVRTAALAVLLTGVLALLIIMLGMVSRQADADRRVIHQRQRVGGVR